MADELLLWGSVLLIALGGVWLGFWVRRLRRRAAWRRKRPIPVAVRRPPEQE
jgi:hypothetical protein